MIVAGALGLGLVVGWAVEFLSWSWASASYRATMAAGLAVVLIGPGATATVFGLTGFVVGAAAHSAMIEEIRRRRI